MRFIILFLRYELFNKVKFLGLNEGKFRVKFLFVVIGLENVKKSKNEKRISVFEDGFMVFG